MGAGLVALVGLTAWAVASVSVWSVLVYLALMVLIFVTPPGRRPRAMASEVIAESLGAGLSRGVRVDCVDGVDQHHSVAGPVSGSVTTELTEPSGSSPDSVGSSTAKPRQGRIRARKVTRTAAGPVPDTVRVAWIQVGPGKFVRVEGGIQAFDQAQTEEVAAGPAIATPVYAPLTSTAPAEVLAAQDLPTPQETISGDEGMVTVSGDSVLGSVTEGIGIAPSAFSPSPPITDLVKGLVHDVSGVGADPEADPDSRAKLGGKMPGRGVEPGRFWSAWRTSRGRTGLLWSGLASTTLRRNRASSRREVRPGLQRRRLLWACFTPNARRQQAVIRAFGRVAHVERALRPRSPPYHRSESGGTAPAGQNLPWDCSRTYLAGGTGSLMFCAPNAISPSLVEYQFGSQSNGRTRLETTEQHVSCTGGGGAILARLIPFDDNLPTAAAEALLNIRFTD